LTSAHAELERRIRSWKFSSGKIDGVPVPTRTHLRLSFEARAGTESKYTLHMTSATAGPDYRHQDAPSYPPDAVHLRRQGLVQLSVRFDENGVVQDVQPYGDKEVDALLAKAARKAVRSWTFSPEVVGGRPRASTVIVPICFAIAGLPPPDCRITDPGTHRSVDGLVAIDPAARLDSDVIERAP
jgi:TonB family protein